MTSTHQGPSKPPDTSVQKWQYCSLSVHAYLADEEGVSEEGLATSFLHRYTPFGISGHNLTDIEYRDTDTFDEYMEKEESRSRLSYPRLFEEIAKLGSDGWEMTHVTRRPGAEDWYQESFWFKRPIDG